MFHIPSNEKPAVWRVWSACGIIHAMNPRQLTLEEKEQIITSWPHPLPDALFVFQKTRDDLLKQAETEEERNAIISEYEGKVNRMFAQPRE
jgi:hypothetical protein